MLMNIIVVVMMAAVIVYQHFKDKSNPDKESAESKKKRVLLDQLYHEGYMSDDDYNAFYTMNHTEQEEFLNECLNKLNEEQYTFIIEESERLSRGIE